MRDASADWESFDPDKIPSKSTLPELETFLARVAPEPSSLSLLDLGCGRGLLTTELSRRGFTTVGVDINAQAIQKSQKESSQTEEKRSANRLRFECRDIVSPSGLRLDQSEFDIVVCQLVISVVGELANRRQLLTNAKRALRHGGHLYLSASGVSSSINEGYARLYERDLAATGERYTYFSRDAAGKTLYVTHHFEREELRRLLEETGFQNVCVTRRKEASSRRVGEAAYFLYATAVATAP